MAYILDTNKKSVGKFVIPTGTEPKITVSEEVEVILEYGQNPSFNITNNGDIILGSSDLDNHIEFNGGICYNFKKIVDNETNYNLSHKDYFIEVVSETYDTITLPYANLNAGCSYIVSRANSNNNNNLKIYSQVEDDIDDRDFLSLKRPGQHINVMSNGENSWYII